MSRAKTELKPRQNVRRGLRATARRRGTARLPVSAARTLRALRSSRAVCQWRGPSRNPRRRPPPFKGGARRSAWIEGDVFRLLPDRNYTVTTPSWVAAHRCHRVAVR